MEKNNGNIVWGYAAGIITGVTYGLNPLFAKPLLSMGVSVDTMLSIRYLLAVAILGVWLLFRKETFRVNMAQFVRLCILGVLFAMSSMLLFVAYNYIPAGLATTIVFLYPVLVALIMVFLKVYPTWQVWMSIVLTFVGGGDSEQAFGQCLIEFRRPASGRRLSSGVCAVPCHRESQPPSPRGVKPCPDILCSGHRLASVHYSQCRFWRGIPGRDPWLVLLDEPDRTGDLSYTGLSSDSRHSNQDHRGDKDVGSRRIRACHSDCSRRYLLRGVVDRQYCSRSPDNSCRSHVHGRYRQEVVQRWSCWRAMR